MILTKNKLNIAYWRTLGEMNLVNSINMKKLKILWTTDIHLNFLSNKELVSFIKKIQNESSDLLLIGGDIGEAKSVCSYLQKLDQSIGCPIYFVLGNHDYYRGSISGVNNDVAHLTKSSKNLFFLDAISFVELTKDTALIGQSGWADGKFGDYDNSEVMLNDYVLINEFIGLDKNQRLKKLHELGGDTASKIESKLISAFKKYKKVICLTHVPPFREACWHEGKISDDSYLPHFSSKSVGDIMKKIMQSKSDCHLEVLCGHTHSSGSTQILDNFNVTTGKAIYGIPKIQKIIYL